MLLLAVVLGTLAGLVAAEFDPELHAKYLTMPKSSFFEYFNAQGYSWKMAKYDNIQSGLVSCVKYLDKGSINKLPLQTHDLEGIELPDNFDARQQWPQCESIKEVSDQGGCGSCWVIATTTIASDRTCIHTDNHVRLSAQDYDCVGYDVCLGNYVEDALFAWQYYGFVTQECKPYNVPDLILNKCNHNCSNGIFYKNDKHYAETTYALPNNNDQIKAELVKNGPVVAIFNVFEDFLNYKSGIYEHLHGEALALQSVRIIGYGVENGTDYWLAANSWGGSWGEHGFFRIKTNQQEVDLENNCLTGMPWN